MVRILHLFRAASGLFIFLMQILGILEKVPVLFVSMGISAFAIGLCFVPGNTISMEVMDYQIWKNGKDRSALTQAGNKFLEKAQGAVAQALIGVILIAIGYSVNSETGAYVGKLSKIPSMLTRFIVIMGFVPFVLGTVTYFIYKKYPITPEVREQMYRELEERNAKEAE